ncbi:cytochrome c oxidase subunit VIa-domain-containing protein [Umbelopsis sp. PMI_123]|nr:cytochrome c oxidase subunit VIa-domain-containing protein [Umbelopsis sp. PMI_123]
MSARLFSSPILAAAKRSGVRFQSTSAFAAERDAVKHHAESAANTWKKISLFVCIPALLASGINAYNLYAHHLEHEKEHPHEWVGYDYMNTRNKDFFWGKESLFFNPKVNHSAAEE